MAATRMRRQTRSARVQYGCSKDEAPNFSTDNSETRAEKNALSVWQGGRSNPALTGAPFALNVVTIIYNGQNLKTKKMATLVMIINYLKKRASFNF